MSQEWPCAAPSHKSTYVLHVLTSSPPLHLQETFAGHFAHTRQSQVLASLPIFSPHFTMLPGKEQSLTLLSLPGLLGLSNCGNPG